MKPGFGSKKNKKKKQKKQKDKGDKAKNADADMAMVSSDPDDGIDYTIPKDTSVTAEISAKDKQRGKMQLKTALKVKVAQLKNARSKLTKIPGNKVQRKEVSAAKQDVLAELAELQKDKTAKKKNKKKNKNKDKQAGNGAEAVAGDGAAAMME